jgi:hypothetical protein
VRVGAEATVREVRMWVEDEGPGLSPEERQRVFDKFYRGKSAAATPGTGIGLAITSEIVGFHGGRIWVEDVVPHGARFAVTLPRDDRESGSGVGSRERRRRRGECGCNGEASHPKSLPLLSGWQPPPPWRQGGAGE